MKTRINIVKTMIDVLMVVAIMLETFFVFLLAINPTMITVYIMIGIAIITMAIRYLFICIAKACIRRYKQLIVLRKLRVTDKIGYIQMREIEEY